MRQETKQKLDYIIYNGSKLASIVDTISSKTGPSLDKLKQKWKLNVDNYFSKYHDYSMSNGGNTIPQAVTLPLNYLEINQENFKYFEKLIKIPSEYSKITEAYRWIENQPQPEQRTKAWFDARDNKITASSAASALDENKHASRSSYLIEKSSTEKEFLDNKYVHHGKKYEPILTMMYEHLNDVMVKEFGLIEHRDYQYLGASPDGIVSPTKRNSLEFTPLFGRMLEIKAPFSRKIEFTGDIDGTICPHYYWIQVQCQLEVCNLEKCDFWQVELSEYSSLDRYLRDDSKELQIDVQNDLQDQFETNDNYLAKRGMIIELLPNELINSQDEDRIFQSKYIYPPSLLMNTEQLLQWIGLTLADLCTSDPGYSFHRIRYWKVKRAHCQTIDRDREWFSKALPKLKDFWTEVIDYRENPEKFNIFLKKYKTRYDINSLFDNDGSDDDE